jgi:putative spermidine/putrescine transport system permease protein
MTLTRAFFFAIIAVVLFWLYFPFVIMGILSFQGPRGGPTFPLHGTSTIWYWKLFHPGVVTRYSDVGEFLGNYLAALGRSVALALIVMVIVTVLALLAAQAFRTKFRASGLIFYLWLLGIVVPGITISLGLALVFRQLGIPEAWYSTTLAVHVMYLLPISLIIFLMFFNRFDRQLEDAALVLGANELRTWWYVTLPILKPAILTSMIFTFTLSLDEYQRSNLITGVQQTLPLMIVGAVTTRITPELYALGTLTTVGSLIVVALYLIFMVRSTRRLSVVVPEPQDAPASSKVDVAQAR